MVMGQRIRRAWGLMASEKPRRERRRPFAPFGAGLDRLEPRVVPTAHVLSGGISSLAITPPGEAQQGATVTTVTSETGPSVYGQWVTLKIHVASAVPGAGVPTGMALVYEGTNPLGVAYLDANGDGSVRTMAQTVGDHAMTAVYTADNTFDSSTSAPFIQSVAKTPTSLFVYSTTGPAAAGGPVTINAYVTSSAPGSALPLGIVTFREGSTVLGTSDLNGGYASLTLPSLSTGTHTIVATYEGDMHCLGSTSPSFNQEVRDGSTTTTLVVTENAAADAGTTYLVSAVVPKAGGTSAPSGQVTFYDGGTMVGHATINGGVAVLGVPRLSAGTHAIFAYYSGDGSFSASNSPTVARVVAAPPASVTIASVTPAATTTTLSITPAARGRASSFVINVSGGTAANGRVILRLNARTTRVLTLTNGRATLTLPGGPRNFRNASATFAGDATHTPSASNA